MQLFLINALCTYVSGFFLFSHCQLLISGSGYFLHIRLNHLESIQGHYQKHSKSLENLLTPVALLNVCKYSKTVPRVSPLKHFRRYKGNVNPQHCSEINRKHIFPVCQRFFNGSLLNLELNFKNFHLHIKVLNTQTL